MNQSTPQPCTAGTCSLIEVCESFLPVLSASVVFQLSSVVLLFWLCNRKCQSHQKKYIWKLKWFWTWVCKIINYLFSSFLLLNLSMLLPNNFYSFKNHQIYLCFSIRILAIKSLAIWLLRQNLKDIIYLGSALAIFLLKQSNKFLYLLQQTPCYFLAVTLGFSYIKLQVK